MGASLVNSDTGDDGASGKKVSAKGVFLIYFLFTRGVRLADFLFAGPEWQRIPDRKGLELLSGTPFGSEHAGSNPPWR